MVKLAMKQDLGERQQPDGGKQQQHARCKTAVSGKRLTAVTLLLTFLVQ
ncbi:MAG: hypothetical protein N839_0007855 [Desulfofustis sp. PB-SRB1]|jgi:hypothetical protein|nr:hypothetical protein [Desulfofustis sp. PB-SRB1]MBM1002315.1 hypothetical protein [Desulfofustis sp. PB-SRB1]